MSLLDQVDLFDEVPLHLRGVPQLSRRWNLPVQLLILDEDSERNILLEVFVPDFFVSHVLSELSN